MIPNPIVVPMTVSESTQQFALGVSEENVQYPLDFGTAVQIIGGAHYEGVYEVTPLADFEVVLPTTGLVMEGDVTVNKIPYYETSNTSGITVYIGG